ncbi:MAG: orotidine-5'-phosphate decarboxylase [Pseudomonadota bacterium]
MSVVVRSPVIVALDFTSAKQALTLAERLSPVECRLKVGKELFTRTGPELVRSLHDRGFEVFLDLKFHDIPNTVAGAVAAAADLGVWMVNVHAQGGRRMMTAARERLQQGGYSTLLTAVTVLTSMEAEELHEVGVERTPLAHVQALAGLAAACDLHGVVCSAQEAAVLRKQLPPDFQLVTPGIRPADATQDDQRRIMTPEQAMAVGVNYLVIGRPITQADDAVAALRTINISLGC